MLESLHDGSSLRDGDVRLQRDRRSTGTAEALGERSPKDIDEPERVYELTIEDALRLRFPGQRPGDGSHQSSSTP